MLNFTNSTTTTLTNMTKTILVTEICPTEMRKSYRYSRDYILTANFVMMLLIPFLLISVMNLMLWKTIRKSSNRNCRVTSRQRRDQKIAMLLITVVVFFIGCNMIRICVNIYEVFHLAYFGDLTLEWPDWAKLLTSLSHLFLVLNSSTNIIIYCWKDDKFRLVLFRMLKLYRPMVHSPVSLSATTTPLTCTRLRHDDLKFHLIAVKENCGSQDDLKYHLLPVKESCGLQSDKTSDCGSFQSSVL